MDLYGEQSSTQESLCKASQSFNHIFEEIPIRINNPHLVEAFLLSYQDDESLFDKGRDFDRLDLATNPFLETNLEFLIDSVDQLAGEQNDFQRYLYRQSNQKKKAGEGADEASGLKEPNLKGMLLNLYQISVYCDEVCSFSGQSFDKHYLLEALQKKGSPSDKEKEKEGQRV